MIARLRLCCRAFQTLIAAGDVRGTPVLISGRDGPEAIWQGVENNARTVQIAPRIGDATTPRSFVVVTNAELPAATANSNRLFVVYIAKGGAGQDVWLVTSG